MVSEEGRDRSREQVQYEQDKKKIKEVLGIDMDAIDTRLIALARQNAKKRRNNLRPDSGVNLSKEDEENEFKTFCRELESYQGKPVDREIPLQSLSEGGAMAEYERPLLLREESPVGYRKNTVKLLCGLIQKGFRR